MRTRSARFFFSLITFSLILLTGVHSPAQKPARTDLPRWTAYWITDSSAPQRDEAVLHFRKAIELAAKPEHFFVYVSADNQFLFVVNGQRVGSGPSRSDLAHWRYETYDIAPMLKPGKNILAATVWNFSTHAALAQMTDRIGFLLQGAGDEERIANTDASWQVEQETGIHSLPAQVMGYYAAEPGERWEGSAFDWQWSAESSSGRWGAARTLSLSMSRGQTDSHNNWQLVSDPLPPMEYVAKTGGKVRRVSGIDSGAAFPSSAISIPAHTKASILIDNGELTTAYPDLEVSGGAASVVRLTYAEALYDGKGSKGNRNEIEGKHISGLVDEFVPGGPDCEFIPLTWRTWRYLQLDVETSDQPLVLKSFRQWFTAYPFQERARFQSEDQSLTGIWNIGWRTARLDAHDTYMDTPYWERLQYIGDTRIQALLSYTVGGDDRLAKQAIDAFNNSRITDGLTQSRYPSSLVQMIPTFSLMWVGMVHDFWMYRGDAEFTRAQLRGVENVLRWYELRLRSDSLLSKMPWWPFVDWGSDFSSGNALEDKDGGSAVISMQLVEALRNAAELEAELGDSRRAADYRATADKISQAVYAKCWNQQYGLLADTPAQKHFSQHANILGVWLDVIPQAEQQAVLRRILSTSDPGFTADRAVPRMTAATYYFRFYLARALSHAGMGEEYLKLLGPWKTMLGLGLTTWAESPEPTRSDSHAWSAHPNFDLLTTVAGIRPTGAGFKSVIIEPQLGGLKDVSAVMPVPQGEIVMKYQKPQDATSADVTLPRGASGQLVWKGKPLPLREGANHLELH